MNGIKFNLQDFFLRQLAASSMDLFEQKVYAPWIMHPYKHRSNIDFKPSCRNHHIFLPNVEVIHEDIYPNPAKAPTSVDVVAHQSFSDHLEDIHISNVASQDRLTGQFRQPHDTTIEATTSNLPHYLVTFIMFS